MTVDQRWRALLAAYEQLDARQQQMLLEFAETLAARDDVPAPAAGLVQPRPAEESVVAAIKRLSRARPAPERRRLMGPVSLLMAQHALQGRAAAEVIDELETLFQADGTCRGR